MINHLSRGGALLLLSILLTGCATLAYYGQAVRGQLELVYERRPLDEVLADPATTPAVRHKIEIARAAREFASTGLALPDNRSYRGYADLGREFVVWNVFAAPPLALEAVPSCFPIAGCLDYRGYFSARAALRHAARRRRQGYEVYVGGVAAYSTLGWFADPILSTMLTWDDMRLVKILFHELAHQRLYVPGDTAFNESFATAVADAGWARWVAAGNPVTAADRAREQRDEALTALLVRYRGRLEQLYASALPPHEKLARKRATFAALAAEYAGLRERWGGVSEYDEWMAQDMNNAKLAAIATYHDHVPAFQRLLGFAGGDLPQFYALAGHVAALDDAARAACLETLAQATDILPACAAPAR